MKIDPFQGFKPVSDAPHAGQKISKIKGRTFQKISEKIRSSSESHPLEETNALKESYAVSCVRDLLELQEILSQNGSFQRSQESGKLLLNELDQLYRRLLTETLSRQDLEHFRSLSERSRKSFSNDDPRLDAIVQEIEQRLAIEVAKLEALESSSPHP